MKSKLNGKVLDFACTSNPNLIVWDWDHHGRLNQLWYMDEETIIRSAVNDDYLTSHGRPFIS